MRRARASTRATILAEVGYSDTEIDALLASGGSG